MHVRQLVGGKESTPSTPHQLFNTPFFYKYNHGLQGKRGVPRDKEKLVERNRNLIQKIYLKQTLFFKVLKPLKVEKSHPLLSLEPRFRKFLQLKFS